jgi:hypothetical protein
MANQLASIMPAQIADLIQTGALERAFHDSLFPTIQFRAEAVSEEFPSGAGEEIIMSRPGLLPAVTKPLTPGEDPLPTPMIYEQWVARIQQFGATMDTHMPTSTVAAANLFLTNIRQQGLQAGMSVNRIARNNLFRAYLAGNTVATAAIGATDTTIAVASLNGFIDVLLPNVSARPQPVSATYALPIDVGTGVAKKRCYVIGFTPNDPADVYGPGQLLLSAAVGAAFVARSPIVSVYASRIVRPSGGTSVDSIAATDTFLLQQVINAVAYLRRHNVTPHDDGFYHAHISPLTNAQIFSDPVYQRLNQSLPDGAAYREGFIGQTSGIMFFLNTDAPETTNTGSLVSTGTSSFYAPDLGNEIVNANGVPIGHTILTGKGALVEKYLDEGLFTTEAGITGKTGMFDIVNNGVAIMTDRIRLIMRAPVDRMQQKVSHTWSITTSFTPPSDILAPSGPERFKRAIVLQHAGY